MAKEKTIKKEEEEKVKGPELGEGGSTKLPPEPKPKKDDVVEIKKEDYDKLMAQLERNANDIALLYKASDKNRMAKALGDGGEILIKTARVWTWDNTGKIVIATDLVSNKSEVVMGKWVEDQNVIAVFEDGSTETVPYLQFVRRTINKIPAEIIATTKSQDSSGKETLIYKLQFANGKILEINAAFVN